MMPRFFKDMPKPQKGMWVACSIRTYAFASDKEVKCVKVRGLVRAYIVARLLALIEDLRTPHYDGEVGVNWGVKKLDNENQKET